MSDKISPRWISDRLPTEADANDNGSVLCKPNFFAPWDSIVEDEYWYPLPKVDANDDNAEEDIPEWAVILASKIYAWSEGL
jgi:hypothetical protein